MEKRSEKWRSPSLGKNMEITIWGESGTPVLALPTRGQKNDQWEEYGMVDALSLQLKEGYNQLFCIDTVDEESFLNDQIPPSKRIVRHQQYETYIVEEVVPYILDHNPIDYIIIAGVDLGGYHAITLALKHPKEFGKAIGMSGLYNIRIFMDDFYDDNVYYNNPVDFIPNLNKQSLLNSIRDVDLRLVSYTQDSRRGHAENMSKVLRMKFIEHKLDIWDVEEGGEWDLWPQMLQTHII